jgi:hypothetical protein
MKLTYWLTFFSILAVSPLFAGENPLLVAQMKALSADVNQISLVTANPDPSQVKDTQITMAVARCRTAAASLQAVLDNKDGDLTAPVIAAETDPTEKAELQKKFVTFLNAAIADLNTALGELKTQFAVTDATKRDFTALAAAMTDLGNQQQNAHVIFNPQN